MSFRCRTFLAIAGRVVPKFLRDCIGLAGVASISYGAWLAWPPAGYVAGGSLALVGVLLSTRSDVSPVEDREG